MGSAVVECLIPDRKAAGSSLTVLSLSKNINPSLVLVQPRKTHPFLTERLLMGRKESNQTNKQTNKKELKLYCYYVLRTQSLYYLILKCHLHISGVNLSFKSWIMHKWWTAFKLNDKLIIWNIPCSIHTFFPKETEEIIASVSSFSTTYKFFFYFSASTYLI